MHSSMCTHTRTQTRSPAGANGSLSTQDGIVRVRSILAGIAAGLSGFRPT